MPPFSYENVLNVLSFQTIIGKFDDELRIMLNSLWFHGILLTIFSRRKNYSTFYVVGRKQQNRISYVENIVFSIFHPKHHSAYVRYMCIVFFSFFNINYDSAYPTIKRFNIKHHPPVDCLSHRTRHTQLCVILCSMLLFHTYICLLYKRDDPTKTIFILYAL